MIPFNIADFETMLKLAERYGVTLFLLLLLIAFTVYYLIWSSKKYDRMFNALIEATNRIPKEKVERLEDVVNINNQIHDILIETSVKFKSDWASVWQFHNGNKGLGKRRIPFMYISLTHEVVSSFVNPMRREFSHLPMSMFPDLCNDIIHNDMLIHKSDGQGKRSPMGNTMYELGARLSYLFTIRDEDGAIVALFTCGFTKVEELSKEEIRELNLIARRIGIVLATGGQDVAQEKQE